MNSVNLIESALPDCNLWLISLPALTSTHDLCVVFFSPHPVEEGIEWLWEALGVHIVSKRHSWSSQGSLEQVNEIIGDTRFLERCGACCTVFHWLISSCTSSNLAGCRVGFFHFPRLSLSMQGSGARFFLFLVLVCEGGREGLWPNIWIAH